MRSIIAIAWPKSLFPIALRPLVAVRSIVATTWQFTVKRKVSQTVGVGILGIHTGTVQTALLYGDTFTLMKTASVFAEWSKSNTLFSFDCVRTRTNPSVAHATAPFTQRSLLVCLRNEARVIHYFRLIVCVHVPIPQSLTRQLPLHKGAFLCVCGMKQE